MNELEEILINRHEIYGDSLENFRNIGIIWGVLLNTEPIEPHKVAQMMIALKLQRINKNPKHEDSWRDIQGYAEHGLNCL